MYDKGKILVGESVEAVCFANLIFVFRLRTAPDVYKYPAVSNREYQSDQSPRMLFSNELNY